ncbi:MAG: aquaporin family protein [Rhodospirillales bacterium]|nr:aquaporin family protein [Rhodospirillales bacterium]
MTDLTRRLAAEFVGTAFLLATVVGSGIMAETQSPYNAGVALLGNTIATGAILAVLILVYGPVSGAHFNPAVTIAFAIRKEITPSDCAIYIVVQIIGALVGTIVAHIMFKQPLLFASTTERTGASQWVGELVATFSLLAAILGCLRWRPEAIPYAVGLVITAGYWYTSSTSFANPAVTIARSFTDTFSGIVPAHMPAFIVSQIVGAVMAVYFFRWLLPPADKD